ncbi:MAG: hypothetical protein IPH69_05355 [Bacteroidales bacterium]|nr:hypothetical protein [Bacteroidales bacterium]
MHNITLIGTVHSESGKCNSDELYRIIETIGPEVIFEELSNDLYDRFYNGNQLSDESLEIKCIKKYLLNHNIKHVPVDIDVSPNLSTKDIEYMFNTFKKYDDVYKKLDNEQNLLTEQDGFDYLNSNKCSELFEKKKTTENYLIEFGINKNLLLHINKLSHKNMITVRIRCFRIFITIAKKNQYNQAVLLIGSAHRKSIMQKIFEHKTKEKLNLNWTFYNNQSINHR